MELDILYLQFNRYTNRAYTLLSAVPSSIMTCIFGYLGIIFSLKETNIINGFNPFLFWLIFFFVGSVCSVAVIIGFISFYNARQERAVKLRQIYSIHNELKEE